MTRNEAIDTLNRVKSNIAREDVEAVKELCLAIYLLQAAVFVPVKDVCRALSISERELRYKDDTPGLRQRASERMECTGFKIISRTGNPSGLKATNIPEEWEAAANQIEAHLQHEKRTVEHLRKPIVATGQLGLGL